MKVTLEPHEQTEGRQFAAGAATLDDVLLEKADGGWSVLIDGLGGPCCTPRPFIAEGASLTMPPQLFTVGKGTPMTVQFVGIPTGIYRSLADWDVRLLDTTTGTNSTGLLRFSRGHGQTVEDFARTSLDGGPDWINYVHAVEFSR